jgi:hypothetical protein
VTFGAALRSHYTPKHGSCLNQAEIETGIFNRPCLGKRRIRDRKTLRREAHAWNRRMNRNRVEIEWKFDRKTARCKFGYNRRLRSDRSDGLNFSTANAISSPDPPIIWMQQGFKALLPRVFIAFGGP